MVEIYLHILKNPVSELYNSVMIECIGPQGWQPLLDYQLGKYEQVIQFLYAAISLQWRTAVAVPTSQDCSKG